MELGKHHGDIVMRQLVQDRFFLAEGHHGHALHLALQHAPDTTGQKVGIAVRGADQNFVAVGDGDLLKTLNQLREEGVCNIFNDDSQ